MLQIDVMSRIPVYEQIVSQVERLVAAGIMSPGDQMPSVRGLSVELSVNPNTIQKAYTELDNRGYVTSVPGKGCFIAPDAAALINRRGKQRLGEMEVLAKTLYQMGVTREEMHDAVDRAVDSDKKL